MAPASTMPFSDFTVQALGNMGAQGGADDNDHLALSLTSCVAVAGDIHLRFQGGLAKIYNVVGRLAVKKYGDELDELMCKELREAVAKSADKIPPLE